MTAISLLKGFAVASYLLDRFVKEVPKQFLVRMLERQHALYQQSIAAAFDERWSAPEALNVLPHLRRAFVEHDFRQTAIACGLKAFDTPHAGDNCTCVLVKAGQLILTAHYVDGPKQFVRDAESRKQNAAVNGWMDEHIDERLLVNPLPKFGNKPIYLNLLHGGIFLRTADGKVSVDSTACFLHIAIPDEASQKYLYNWSAQEILLAYSTAATQTVAVLEAIEDKAKPRAKAQFTPKKTASGDSK